MDQNSANEVNTYSNFVNALNYGLDQQGNLVVNGNLYVNDVAMFDCNMYNGVKVKTPFVNVLSLNSLNVEGAQVEDLNYMCYMVGLNLGGYDSWDKSTLNGEKVIITNQTEGKVAIDLLKANTGSDSNSRPYISNVQYLYIAGDNVMYKTLTNEDVFLKIDLSGFIPNNTEGYEISFNDTELEIISLGQQPLEDGTNVIYKVLNSNFEIAVTRTFDDIDGTETIVDVVRLKFKPM